MSYTYPEKVIITGGHEIGGVGSFADSLRQGFSKLGIEVEIVSPGSVFRRLKDLRNPRILKILSTTAVFAAPFCRRTICIAHGVPRADYQGWKKLTAIIGSFKLANRCAGTRLVSVSHYTATTLRAVFDVRTDAVIHNPAKPLYLEPRGGDTEERRYITYVGRLIAAKNLHRILPAIRDVLDANPGMKMCIIGRGEQRTELEAMVQGDARFEFPDAPEDHVVRDYLRRTKVFVSGNEVEGFGIAYLEALSQGCNVAMPASGGGLEIAPEEIGRSVQLLPLSWDHAGASAALRRAISVPCPAIDASNFTIDAVVGKYVAVDHQFR